jgi:hypothetical protein
LSKPSLLLLLAVPAMLALSRPIAPAQAAETAPPPPHSGAAQAVGRSPFRLDGSAAAAPTLGTASLTVDDQIHLGAASDLFKDGALFLWSDATGNPGLGTAALASNSTGQHNTAVGAGALTASTTGSNNTAIGDSAMGASLTATRNTAVGFDALEYNEYAQFNTAVGYQALRKATGTYVYGFTTYGDNTSTASWASRPPRSSSRRA